MSEHFVGKVTHYFSKAHVAAIEIKEGALRVGDTIHVVGHTSNFTQKVDSMQKEHARVETAMPGDNVGIQVTEHAREHDDVYVVTAD